VVAVFVWGFITGLILFSIIRTTGKLRVTEEAERMGLNVHEHGASSGLIQTMTAMENIIQAYNDNSAQGDLTRRVEVEIGSESGDVAALFNQLMQSFHDTIVEIKKGSAEIDRSIAFLKESSGEMEKDSLEQKDAIDTITSAIQQMAQSINEVARNTSHTADCSRDAVEHAEGGRAVVSDTIAAIHRLSERIQNADVIITDLEQNSEAIFQILDTIKGISDQTNLLALNAAIEAARAGDSGRGFAVVAGEVRELSARTQEATDEINNLVELLRSSARQASQAMAESRKESSHVESISQEADKRLHEILDIVTNIQNMSFQNAAITEQQSAAAGEVNNRMQSMQEVSHHSDARARKLTESSVQLNQLSERLKGIVGNLNVIEDSGMMPT
jgi:Amt family ammonium transporter